MKLTRVVLLSACLCLAGDAQVLTGRAELTGRAAVGKDAPPIMNGPLLTYGNEAEGWGFFGSRVVFTGKNAWFEFVPHWAYTITCNAATDTCDSAVSGHIPNSAEEINGNYGKSNSLQSGVYITSTGTLPAGLIGQHGGVRASYHICDIDGTTFSLRRGLAGQVTVVGRTVRRVNSQLLTDFNLHLVAGRSIKLNSMSYTITSIVDADTLVLATAPGNGNYTFDSACGGVQQTFTTNGTGNVHILYDPNIAGQPYYLTSVSGLNATVSWWQGGPNGIEAPLVGNLYQGLGNPILQLEINPLQETGDQTLLIGINTMPDGSGDGSVAAIPVKVMDVVPVSTGTPSSYPAIPGRSAWESTMTAAGGGGNWCNKTTGVTNPAVLSFGAENEIWYYDGARVYSQIANYTGDTNWNKCRTYIATRYKVYTDSGAGAVPGQRRFPHGLALEYIATGNAAFKASVDALCSAGPAASGGRVTNAVIRETAYALDCYVVQERDLGEARPTHMVRAADFLIGHLLAYSHSGYRSIEQAFYNGLAMEALIGYYELTADERVPIVLEATLAHMYGSYNATTHVMPYSPDPDGAYCWSTASTFKSWFRYPAVGRDGDCNDSSASANGWRSLNNLYASAWAWMFRHTGRDLYRQQGDELFRYTLQIGDPYPFSGKSFSQAYRLGFDYVTWRSAP